MRDLECDYSGHKQKNAGLKEYGGPPSEIVSGVVTKAQPEEKMFACAYGASFKTNQVGIIKVNMENKDFK